MTVKKNLIQTSWRNQLNMKGLLVRDMDVELVGGEEMETMETLGKVVRWLLTVQEV